MRKTYDTFYFNVEGGDLGGGGSEGFGNTYSVEQDWMDPRVTAPSVDDMFKGLEEYFMGGGEKPIIRPNDPTAKGTDPKFDPRAKQPEAKPVAEEEIDDLYPEEIKPKAPAPKAPEVKKSDFQPLELEVDGLPVKVKSKEQLQQHLARSIKATELYQEYNTIKTEYNEVKQDLEYQDYLKQNHPEELLELLTADIPFEKLKGWMKERIKFESMTSEQKAQYQQWQEGKKALERMKRLEQKEAELAEKQAQKQAEEDYKAVMSLRQQVLDTHKGVLDPKWIEAVVDSQIERAKAIQESGRDVSLKQLQMMVRSIIDPVAEKLKKNVKPTERLRQSTSPGGVDTKPQGSISQQLAKNPMAGFEALKQLYK
jgi:hypothetical protein